MQVAEIMRRQPRVCSLGNSLATAGRIMDESDCGLLPVLDSDDRLVGVITERDVCVELAQRERRASEVRVSEIVHYDVHTCTPDEDVRDALVTMRRGHVRRLPVLGEHRLVKGILCLDDVILATWTAADSGVEQAEIATTLKAVSRRLDAVRVT